MNGELVGLLAFLALLLFVSLGMYVPVALMFISFLGIWILKGSTEFAINLLAHTANEAINNYFLGAIPLFILMGNIIAVAGLGEDAFRAASALLRRIKSGLGVATVFSNALFAAITGVTIASAAVFTRIAVPEMQRHGYSRRFATGIVAGSSVLGMLIPPSIMLLIYAFLSEQSVGDMFIAGVIPGILLAITFSVAIPVIATLAPGDLRQSIPPEIPAPSGTITENLLALVPLTALMLFVIGGIYLGFFTPVEAGAAGTFFSIMISLFRRRLDLDTFLAMLKEAGVVFSAIAVIMIAAQMYARLLAFTGLPADIAGYIFENSQQFWLTISVYILFIILLGMILDGTSVLLIMVPLALPVAMSMDLNLVWFGIVSVLAAEIGLLTPPFGTSVFVIKATADDSSLTLGEIFIGAFPFAVLTLLVVILLVNFPILTTILLR